MVSSEAVRWMFQTLIFYTGARGCATGICVRSTQTRLLTHFAPSSGATKTQMPLFKNATFEISICFPGGLPPPIGAEIAFAGRSNAGKSSAINTLTDTTGAFVSKTPAVHPVDQFLQDAMWRGAGRSARLWLCRGAGKDPPSMAGTARALSAYQKNLIGLVVIMDSRHPLKQLDRQMLDWFCADGTTDACAVDQIRQALAGRAQKTLLEARRDLAAWGGQVTVQLFSSLKKQGMDEVEGQSPAGSPTAAPAFAGTRSRKHLSKKNNPRPKGKNAGVKTPQNGQGTRSGGKRETAHHRLLAQIKVAPGSSTTICIPDVNSQGRRTA